jgi:hypothetical protein
MKAQRFVFLAAAFVIGAAGYGCSSKSGNGSTGAGGSGQTTGAGGGTTSSTTHSTTSHAGGGSTGTGGSNVGGAGGGAASSNLGAACSADADCGGGGLTCIKSTDNNAVFGGGPAAGYCSKECTQNTDCPGDGSLCIKAQHQDPKGICLLGCAIGPALTYIDEPQPADKCQGRDDVRCNEFQPKVSACVPTCGADIQCDGNKKCDPRSGVCVDTPSTGKAEGQPCDPNAKTPECAGVCVQFSTGAGGAGGGGGTLAVCSSFCVVGGQPFQSQLDCGGFPKGLCAFMSQGAGSGDNGFCTPGCKSQDECDFPDFGCMLTGLTNDNGFCFGGVDPCTEADLGTKCIDPQTKKPGTLVCTETTLGPKCVDPTYPLGKYAPGDAGVGGGDAGVGGGDAGK